MSFLCEGGTAGPSRAILVAGMRLADGLNQKDVLENRRRIIVRRVDPDNTS